MLFGHSNPQVGQSCCLTYHKSNSVFDQRPSELIMQYCSEKRVPHDLGGCITMGFM